MTNIDALMDGQTADLVFTSPPYAQQRDYGTAKEKMSNWDALMFNVFSILPVKAGVRCFGSELDPRYCDVAVRRFQNFTGEDVVHEQTCETFNSIIEKRDVA